jgi:hypothetical protein
MAKDKSKDTNRMSKVVLNAPEPLTWAPNQYTPKELDEHKAKMFGKYAEGLDDYRAAQAKHENEARGL